jgi:hypothetical protein
MRLRTYLQAVFLAPVLLAGCRDANGPSTRVPVGPPAGPPVPPVSSPAQPPAFPPVPSNSVVYAEAAQVYNHPAFTAMHGALVSRFVLNTGGSLGLQFSSATYGFFEYSGSYMVSGDSLSVEYNVFMQHSDFMNGLYVRVR